MKYLPKIIISIIISTIHTIGFAQNQVKTITYPEIFNIQLDYSKDTSIWGYCFNSTGDTLGNGDFGNPNLESFDVYQFVYKSRIINHEKIGDFEPVIKLGKYQKINDSTWTIVNYHDSKSILPSGTYVQRSKTVYEDATKQVEDPEKPGTFILLIFDYKELIKIK